MPTGEILHSSSMASDKEEKYRSLLYNIPDLVWTVDSQLRVVFLTPNVEAIFGYTPKEIYSLGSKGLIESVHPEDVDKVLHAFEELVRTGKQFDLECRIRHKNGEYIWVHDRAIKTYEQEGLRLADGLITDITERKQAEIARDHALRETEVFLDIFPSVIIATTCEPAITHWNKAAAEILGVKKDQVLGKRLSDCGVKWVDRSQIVRFENCTLEKQFASEDQAAFLNDKGEKRLVGLTARFIPRSEVRAETVIISGADVTDRRTLQVQAGHTQKMEAIGQLSAGIAHEINTPTQYVSDNLTFLKDSWKSADALMTMYRQAYEAAGERLPEQWRTAIQEAEKEFDFEFISVETPRAIDQALDGVQRVAKIVRAMKEFSHPDTAEKVAVDINKAIETTVTVARNEWKYVAEVKTEFDDTLAPIPCYAGEFNQVILNLIINAAHAIKDVVQDSGQKGLISIRTRTKGEVAEISISDSGTGIPEDIRSRIFDPFFTTKEVGKGTGQGLALAHSIVVKKHAGKIWFETEVGGGTTFFIDLPLHPAGPEQEDHNGQKAAVR